MTVLEQARAAFPEVFGIDAEVKPLTFAADLELATALSISLDRVAARFEALQPGWVDRGRR
jgi:hypothetical protein